MSNDTTGAFTLVVKTVPQVTGVTILQNNRNILYCNGTDVIAAESNTVSFPIPVAQGGTGATTASGARTNLGVPPDTRLLTAGLGLTGGGDLTADRTFALSHLGIQNLTDPGADRIMFWDDSAGFVDWLTVGSGLAISGTTLSNSNPATYAANKSGTTSRNTTVTITADPDLQLTSLPAGSYMVDLIFAYRDSGGASQGIRFQLAGTNATLQSIVALASSSGSAPVTNFQSAQVIQNSAGSSPFDFTHTPGSSVFEIVMNVKAKFVLSSTGTIEFQWAQATSNGNNTEVKYGCMVATKVA
jgi:hypothetical protein